MKKNFKAATEEVKRLIREYGGVITAAQLVECAKDEKSPLHPYFTWNDTEAAEKCRILEARDLLRCVIEVIPNGSGVGYTRVTTHLSTDKEGYRCVADVLTDEQLTEIMLNDALSELQAFKRKYTRLNQLAGVFEAIDKVA